MTHAEAYHESVKLAGVLPRLRGRLRYEEYPRVDVGRTNEVLVLRRHPLAAHVAIAANSAAITRASDAPMSHADPSQIAVVILCGGLNQRGGGAIHPLAGVRPGWRLLDIRLAALSNSCLARAELWLLASPLNAEALKVACGERATVYTGGLVPRLSPLQPSDEVRTSEPRSYAPAGHFDALRWLVVTGQWLRVMSKRVLCVTSFSNFGLVFSDPAPRLTALATQAGQRDSTYIGVVEVVARAWEPLTGSFLVRRIGDDETPRLIKLAYGSGSLSLVAGEGLFSTNSWWFHVSRISHRLQQACDSPETLESLLNQAHHGHCRERAAEVFDNAFSVNPTITHRTVAGREVLQAERDLDQITLLDHCKVLPVQVSQDRAVSIKCWGDLVNPEKTRYLDMVMARASDI